MYTYLHGRGLRPHGPHHQHRREPDQPHGPATPPQLLDRAARGMPCIRVQRARNMRSEKGLGGGHVHMTLQILGRSAKGLYHLFTQNNLHAAAK